MGTFILAVTRRQYMADDTIYAGDTIYSKQGPAFLLRACRETGVLSSGHPNRGTSRPINSLPGPVE